MIISGENTHKARKQLSELRLEMGNQLGLRDKTKYSCLWVVDFPLLEWDEETQRYYAMHHPFTSPKPEDIAFLDTDAGKVRANAYDMVINGVEVGGGSVRIHDSGLQKKMFQILGFTEEKAEDQFGFLMNAFKFGAPPHGGVAFGLDRLVSLFAGLDSIRDCIAFPKNNQGRDVMIDAPSLIEYEQVNELAINVIIGRKIARENHKDLKNVLSDILGNNIIKRATTNKKDFFDIINNNKDIFNRISLDTDDSFEMYFKSQESHKIYGEDFKEIREKINDNIFFKKAYYLYYYSHSIEIKDDNFKIIINKISKILKN